MLGGGYDTGSSKAAAARVIPRRFAALCAVCALTLAGAVQAKLPPPTPEQIAAADATAQKAKEQAAIEQEALTRAQDRTVSAYQSDLKKRGITPPTPTPVGSDASGEPAGEGGRAAAQRGPARRQDAERGSALGQRALIRNRISARLF